VDVYQINWEYVFEKQLVSLIMMMMMMVIIIIIIII